MKCLNCKNEMPPSQHVSKAEAARRDKAKRFCNVTCSNEYRAREPEYLTLHCPYCGDAIPKFDKYGRALSRSKYLEHKTCGKSKCQGMAKMSNRRSGPAKPKTLPWDVRDCFNFARGEIKRDPRDWETAEASDAARLRFRRV